MAYIGKIPSPVPLDASDIPANSIDASKLIDGSITIADIADDAVTADKLANSINTEIAANTAKVTNSTNASDLASGTVAADRLSTANTQLESDDSSKIATTAYVVDKITTLIGGAPSTLNDLNELAAAINDDSDYNSTLTTALATKLPLAGGAMTGNITFGDSTGTGNNRVKFGAGTDLSIFHDSGDSYIEESGTGALYIASNEVKLTNALATANMVLAQEGGAVRLYHNGNEKLETTSTGLDITGNVVVSGTVDGIDIATRDAILTSTTTTAGAALPKAGGSLTGATNLTINQTANTQFSIVNNSGGTGAHASLKVQTGGGASGDPFIHINNEVQHISIGIDNSDGDKFKISDNTTLGTNDRFVIDSSGNVGIGTSSPAVSLDIGDADGGSAGVVGKKLRISQDLATTYAEGNAASYGGITLGNNDETSNNTGTGITFYSRSSSSGIAGIASTSAAADRADLRFITRGSDGIKERMRIISSGNVGIGDPAGGAVTPSAKLQVNQATTTAPSLTFGATAGQILRNEDAEFAFGLSNASPYSLWMQGRFTSNSARNIGINPLGGNVGIGTDSPSTTLEVSGVIASSTRRNYTTTRAHTGTTINLLVSNHSANSSSGRWFTVKGSTCGPGNAGNAGMYEFVLRAYSGDGTGGSGVYNFAILSTTTTSSGSVTGSTPSLSWSGSGSTRTLVLNVPSWQGSSGVAEFGGYVAPGNVTWA